jgi:SAM-dependent methyltransferase
MGDSRFDVAAVFDPVDYLYFYSTVLTPERTAREIDLVWRLLDLQPGASVLDLACGHGRMSNALAARGCSVVGLDLTTAFLDLAQREATFAGLSVEYVEGDMRALSWPGRFDHVLIWFTAFGYFDDEQNRQVLAQAYRALKPGGKLLIDLNNRDHLLAHYQHASVVERDGNYMIDQMRYDVATGRNHIERRIVRDGHTRRMEFFVRLLTFPELRTWLEQAGFREVSGYDQEGSPFDVDSRRMIMVASK